MTIAASVEADESISLPDERSALDFSIYAESTALQIGIDSYRASLFRLACSEIAMNAVRHGRQAMARVRQTDNQLGLMAEILDSGDGISNLDQAKQDGFSTFGSLGLGLGVAERSVERLQIQTCARGTRVTLEQYRTGDTDRYQVAQINFPAVGKYKTDFDIRATEFGGDGLFVDFNRLKKSGSKVAIDPFLPLPQTWKQLRQNSDERCMVRVRSGALECTTKGDFQLFLCIGGAWSPMNPRSHWEQPICGLIVLNLGFSRVDAECIPVAPSPYDIAKHIYNYHAVDDQNAALCVIQTGTDKCSTATFY